MIITILVGKRRILETRFQGGVTIPRNDTGGETGIENENPESGGKKETETVRDEEIRHVAGIPLFPGTPSWTVA